MPSPNSRPGSYGVDAAAAESRIRPYVRETPLVASRRLGVDSGVDVYFKLENTQEVGSFLVDQDFMCSKVPSLHRRYPASSLLRTSPPPSRLRPTSRCRRLYDLPGSTDFSMGRGRLLQLPSMPLSPCCPYHPAGVIRLNSQSATHHAAFDPTERARPPDLKF